MVQFLVVQIRLGKLTLEDVQAKYPKYYEQVKNALGK